jgi:hypothetical protein
MSTNFPPPPTYADVVVINKSTGQSSFNPVWLKWFLDLTTVMSQSGGGGGGGITHNSLSGLQGGTTNEYYHLTDALFLMIQAIAYTSGGVLYGTGSGVGTTPAGTAGQPLVSNGTGAPVWKAGWSGTFLTGGSPQKTVTVSYGIITNVA